MIIIYDLKYYGDIVICKPRIIRLYMSLIIE